MGEPTKERGGKARRCVEVTAQGLRAVRESRLLTNRMWNGLEAKLKGTH